jgi:hypothetical protein
MISKTDENVDQMIKLIHKNKKNAICRFGNMLGISYGSVHSTLKDNLNVHQTATQLMPHACSLCFVWLKTKLMLFYTLLTHHTWCCVTSYFPKM